MPTTKQKAKHTHIPTKWGIAILIVVLIGMIFAVAQVTNQEKQTYQTDAAGKKYIKPVKKAPTPAKRRAPTPARR